MKSSRAMEFCEQYLNSLDGEPRARVLPSSPIALNIHDLGKNNSAIEDEAVLQRHCAASHKSPSI
jgi:hypothetical protein